MIKVTAVVLVALGLSASGFYFAAFYSKKTEAVSNIIMMLGIIRTQLRYSRMPLGALVRLLEENAAVGSLGFFSRCIEINEKGEAFGHSWEQSIKETKELCRLVPESLPYLIQFGERLGTTDLEGQLSCCEYYEHIFGEMLKEKEEQSKKYSKLFPTLGIMLGISAAILIV